MLVVALATMSCARQEAPTGGPPDVRPPVVIATYPEPGVTVGALDGPVRFEFDERISEQVSGGNLSTAVSVSPRSGAVRVKHGRRSLEVEVEDGFAPGTVYRVTMAAVVSDLFGNRLADPFELIFSTGETPVATTLAGEIWDRTTGRPQPNALVLATDQGGRVHEATADAAGIFAFRYLPGGTLTVAAFEDVNRNADLDSAEVQGTVTADIVVGDTTFLDIAVLAPDTLPAVLGAVTVLDSVTVYATFDDYLDPGLDARSIAVRIEREDGVAPGVEASFHEAGYSLWVDSVVAAMARDDSVAAAQRADSAVASVDSVATPTDTVRVEPQVGAGRPAASAPQEPRRRGPTPLEPLQGSTPGLTADGRRVLPSTRLVFRLADTLATGVEYEVTLEGIRNINGLEGGGGSAPAMREAPPDTTAVDSLAADTAVVDTVVADTGVAGVGSVSRSPAR